ncbi:MAG: hypothetical protein GY817_08320 [bacterium]|nr:hypothetical protein [bacterium]
MHRFYIRLQVYLILFLLIFVAINTAAVVTSLKILQKKRLETTDLFFAKSLAARVYRDIIEENIAELSEKIFKEKQVRDDKIEYIMVYDKKGYLIAYTYFTAIPKKLISLETEVASTRHRNQRITRIKEKGLSVYDIGVPVLEGVMPVGSLHIGIKSSYLRNLFLLAIIPSLVVIFIQVFLIVIFRENIARLIISPSYKISNTKRSG